MSRSPRTPRYELRSRKNSPDGKLTNKKVASKTFPSSLSESSDTEDITTDEKKTQKIKSLDIAADDSQPESSDSEDIASDDEETKEIKSSDIAADETDAGISGASARNVTVTDNSKDSRTDKSKAEMKCDNKENTGKQSIPTPTLLQIFIFLAIGISLVVKFRCGTDVVSFPPTCNQNVQSNERPVAYRLENLTTELEHVKAKYQTLDDTFWDVIVGSSWGHIQGNGTIKQPVVLLLVGQPKSSILDVVAKDVARLYSNVFTMRDDSIIDIDGGWQAMKEADQAKLDMDNDLENGFNNGRKVVLLRQFDKLPPCSIMLFHSYCDNENAPHKDAVIIFTVELETTVSSIAQSIEELVQEHLGSIWAQCPEELLQDKIMAMHSRVSNNIAFVK
eukprot:XP_003726840.1 PREDICTED: torsin-1A-interacting protein 1-like [Strongylocentrotus purpuratus]